MANVATSVEYLTGHHNLNLHGVASPAFFGNRLAEREAGVFEALTRLPAAERPSYLITSVSTQDANPSLRELLELPVLYQTTSFEDEILIGRMRYELVGKNGRHFLPETQAAIQGLAEVDRLNVCDTWDEAAHGYTFSSHLGNLVLNGTPRIDSYQLAAGPERVIDAGRAILGYEAFNVRAAPGRDLVVVMRTAPSTEVKLLRPGGLTGGNLAFAEAGLLLTAGGRPIGRFQFRPRAGWDEQVLRVPAAAVSEPSLRLEIRGRYASFYYWFYQ